MKLGIAGAGMIVNDLLSFITQIPEYELTAICATERSEEKLTLMKEQYGFTYIYTDYEEMLANTELDVIYIGTPNSMHYDMAKQALMTGRHVICEKPFTSNARELKELFEIADKKDLLLIEAISTQYNKNYFKIKELLPSIGQIRLANMNFLTKSSRYDAFLNGEVPAAFNPIMSGGALMDLNIYNIHFITGLFGRPDHVSYYANMDRGVDTSGTLILEYEDFKCVCNAAKDSTGMDYSWIQGSNGYISTDIPVNFCKNFTVKYNAQDAKRIENESDRHRMYDEFKSFAEIILNEDRETYELMKKKSIIVMEVIDLAKKSAGLVFEADRR